MESETWHSELAREAEKVSIGEEAAGVGDKDSGKPTH